MQRPRETPSFDFERVTPGHHGATNTDGILSAAAEATQRVAHDAHCRDCQTILHRAKTRLRYLWQQQSPEFYPEYRYHHFNMTKKTSVSSNAPAGGSGSAQHRPSAASLSVSAADSQHQLSPEITSRFLMKGLSLHCAQHLSNFAINGPLSCV